jgi:arabinofuranan 3-O-arabinosyltransferase
VTVATAARARAGNRRLLIGLTALSVVAALAFGLKVSRQMQDFEVYFHAAERALGGESLYRPEDGHWLFKYLPAFAVATAPMALLPLQAAKAIWFGATVAALVLLLRLSIALLAERRKRAWILVAATIVVLGKFYLHEIVLGQSNLLLATAIAGALLAMKRGRELLAGVLIVVAIVLKPYAAIFLPWLLARRRYGSIAGSIVGMAAVVALPVARYGFPAAVQLHRDWWHTVVTSVEPNLFNVDNVSWVSMYSRWLGPGPAAQSLAAATALVALGGVVYVYRRRDAVRFPELLEGGLLLTLMPLISPQGWDYTLLVATPAVMCLVNDEDRLPGPLRVLAIVALAAVGLSIYDLLGRTLYTAFMEHSGITVAFFVILAALISLRRRRIA